ncbi:MAG: ABC transporter ATP-binding protein, partial [Thermoplasmata archaeon]|nr:ABC transporter ATP-binding protein [Thermoplasmata archaeon]
MRALSIGDAISVDHLTVRLGTLVALRDVSLSVRSGELLAVAGPNGSGKTTLIRSILGLQSTEGGQVNIVGVPAGQMSLADRARQLAWMPQEEPPGDNVTLFDYVLYGRHPHVPRFGGDSEEDRTASRHALAQVGLGERAGDRTWEISGGERQRLRLARVLAQSTPILLLDEPTAHLDMAHQ